MLRIVGGLPGSGKSYFAANFIAKYGSYDKLYQTFSIEKELLLFTNLDGLQIAHRNLDAAIEKCGGADKFLTIENFQKIRDAHPKAHILIIIDEAQRIVDDELCKSKDVRFFFQYHRHLGLDIFLLTNDIKTVSQKAVCLTEFVIEAQPRSKGLPGVFRYKFLDTKGTFLFSQSVRLKQEVFSIYKSFTTDETEKPKNVVLHWLVMGMVVLTLTVVGFKFFVNGFMHKKNNIIGKDGKRSEKVVAVPVQKSYSAAKVAVPVVPVVPARVVPHVRRSVAHSPALPLPLPRPVASIALPPVLPPPVPDGWFQAAVTGTIQVGEKTWYSIAGSDPLPSSDCKRYNSHEKTALCRQIASASE